jgi:cell division protein DivIC
MLFTIITFLDRNKFYTYTFCGMVIWMTFFDSNDFGSMLDLRKKISELKAEIEFYDQKIVEVKVDKMEVFGNHKLQEKFAREKYFMKKADEEVFVIVDKDDQPIEAP